MSDIQHAKWSLQRRPSALPPSIEFRNRMQVYYYICGPKHKSDFVADLYVNSEGAPDEIANLVVAAPELLAACVQARGALRLDHMVDDDGKPFGTTTVAMEALDAAISKAQQARVEATS